MTPGAVAPEKLAATQKEIAAKGGACFTYSCDLTDMAAIDALAKQILADHGGVDFLVNNAGRSIRRAVIGSIDRFHDDLSTFDEGREVLGGHALLVQPELH